MKINFILISILSSSSPGCSPYLRVSLEVSLLSRLVVARVRAWGRGLASWEGVGEAGGTCEGGRRSLICPPWKVLLTVDPLERRDEGVEDEEEAPEAPAMLWVEGEAGGRRWDKVLEGEGREKGENGFVLCKLNQFIQYQTTHVHRQRGTCHPGQQHDSLIFCQ